MERYLFGGRVTYQGERYHVLEVNHLNNTYTLEPDYGGKNVTGVKASECEPYDQEEMMDSVLYAFLWFAIALITVTTMKFAGGWVLLPVVLVIILAFIAGRMREGW